MGWVGGGETEQKRKRTHGHGQCGAKGEGGYKGINGNGKNTIKIKFKNSH